MKKMVVFLTREEYSLAQFGNDNPKPYEEYLKDFVIMEINKGYKPEPFRIDIVYESDLEVFTCFISQRLSDGTYFAYLSQYDMELKCLNEIELSPDVLKLIRNNKDLIDKVKSD